MVDRHPVLLVTYPRSASNLLARMLSLDDQPNVVRNATRGYHFLPMAEVTVDAGLWAKPLSESGDGRDRLRKAARGCFESLEKTRTARDGDRDGAVTFVKEHVIFMLNPDVVDEFLFGRGDTDPDASHRPWRVDGAAGPEATAPNDTIFSGAYLRQWKTAFLIRHPALAFPSYYRCFVDMAARRETKKAIENVMSVNMTLQWSRRLYDLASELSQSGGDDRTARDPDNTCRPIVLEADDIMSSPAVVQKFAADLGLDPGKVRSTWSPLAKEERDKMKPAMQSMLSTISASSGIIAGKIAGDIDIGTEVAKWRLEFGDEGARKLETWVRAAMPDYLYLREKRQTL